MASGSSSRELVESLIPLIPSNPDALPLLRSLRPFRHPSLLPRTEVHRLLTRLNGHVLNKELGVRATQERKDSWDVAACLLEQDEEGYIINGWGKNWITGLMPLVLAPTSPSSSLSSLLCLLSTLFTLSPGHPSFSRETALPAIPKYSQALVTLLARAEEKAAWDVIATILPHLPAMLKLSPSPHRPLIPTLLPLLHRFLLLAPLPSYPPSNKTPTIRSLAANLLSTLHVLTGKVSAPAAWKTDFVSTINEMHACLTGITRGGFIEEGVYGSAGAGAKGPVTSAFGMFDPSLAEEDRIARLRNCLDGWLELLLALMRYPTVRPVTVPIGLIIGLSLRLLSLNYETPTPAHTSHEHKAKLMTSLPNLWVIALKILGRTIMTLGAHMLPSLGTVLEHTIFLQETLPKTALPSRIALLRFHKLLLSRLQPDPSSSAFPVRLLKDCLSSVSTVLAPRPAPTNDEADHSNETNVNGLSKKGKKRMRNAVEESLVAGMEGRGGRSMSRVEGVVVLAALDLIPHLLVHPALPEHHLALAIRIHLSLSLALPTRSALSVSDQDITLRDKLIRGVARVLESAMSLSGGHGSRRAWASLLVGLPEMQHSAQLPLLLHPELPPLSRPFPPSSTLHFYRPETEDEKALRVELGISTDDEDQMPITEAEIKAAAQARALPEEEEPDIRPQKRHAVDSVVDWGGAPAPTRNIPPEVSQPSSVFGSTYNKAPQLVETTPQAADHAPATATEDVRDEQGSIPISNSTPIAQSEPVNAFNLDLPVLGFTTAGLPPVQLPVPKLTDSQSEMPAGPSATLLFDIEDQAGTSERKEGVRYDSEGEEIPEICLDSDTEDESDSDHDMA